MAIILFHINGKHWDTITISNPKPLISIPLQEHAVAYLEGKEVIKYEDSVIQRKLIFKFSSEVVNSTAVIYNLVNMEQ